MLDQLIGALGNIDYPDQLLDIKIIMEADDRETIQSARQLVFDSRFEIVIVPMGHPRTKPRALNYALEFARGDIVTVYDAEDVPHPGQLRAAAEAFAAADDRLACLQAPLNWYNHHSQLAHPAICPRICRPVSCHFAAIGKAALTSTFGRNQQSFPARGAGRCRRMGRL